MRDYNRVMDGCDDKINRMIFWQVVEKKAWHRSFLNCATVRDTEIGESRSPWKRVTADVPVLRKVKIVFKAKRRWMQRRRKGGIEREFFFCVNHIFRIASIVSRSFHENAKRRRRIR